jgi:CubicO group peptidase (beta-lactamase class C family)
MTSSLDDFVASQTQEHRIPGLSLALIDGDKITKAQGYGFSDQAGKFPVTILTLFQAASLSKCLTAVAALRLVEQGRLSLDEDVNVKLRSWKIPPNEFSKKEQVTLRRLLSHNAGVNIHGFPGYAVGQPIPTLSEVLNGTPPANNPAIRVDTIPGTTPRYSGGGYVVLQQLLIDVSGLPFPELMQTLVLQPLGMTSSSFQQPLPESFKQTTATGHTQNGQPISGGARLYPEMAAAGLWTTPSDLALFVIGIQQSLAGQSNSILSASMTHEMLTPHPTTYGLGPLISGTGKTLKFFHSGRNAGFDAFLMAHVETGKGAVIMMNANAGPKALNSILKAIFPENP